HCSPLVLLSIPRPPTSPLFPYTTLFRSLACALEHAAGARCVRQPQQTRDLGHGKPFEAAQPDRLQFERAQMIPQQRLHGLFLLRSEEHTSELQSRGHLVCRLLLEKKNNT